MPGRFAFTRRRQAPDNTQPLLAAAAALVIVSFYFSIGLAHDPCAAPEPARAQAALITNDSYVRGALGGDFSTDKGS
jgi:hypothetical protein